MVLEAVADGAAPARRRRRAPLVPVHWLLVGGPALFLLVFFVIPSAFHLSLSMLRSEGGIVTGELTLDNYREFFASRLMRDVLLRTLMIGVTVGLVVVAAGFPLAYYLTRTTSRWKSALIALCFAPLLASVIVRTYGWYTILGSDGIVNQALLGLGLVGEPVRFIPSLFAIVVGLTHVLLPYGVLTIMSSLQGINPNLERAAMNLGASRTQTFFRVLLPLALPGVMGGFFLAFAITLSAYATPAILGGPRTETMATMIYAFMTAMFDWSMGSALGAILVVTAMLLLFAAARAGARQGAL